MMPSSDDEINQMYGVPNRKAVGCLTFATQSFCQLSVSTIVSRFSDNPGKAHWTAYTKTAKLVYRRTENALTVYSDSDFGNDRDDRRSISGCVVCHSGAAIAWTSKKQRTVALSTTEAEYMALSHAAQETAWLRSLQS
ncbi:Retrovirus-related Pol polyprotein from transposon TNT 1-94, partial [Trichinella britovi]